MIAQVFNFTAATTQTTQVQDEVIKQGQEAVEQLRKSDGCEGVLTLADETGQHTMQINLYRDRASMEAAEPLRKKLSEPFLDGGTLSEPSVYEVILHL